LAKIYAKKVDAKKGDFTDLILIIRNPSDF